MERQIHGFVFEKQYSNMNNLKIIEGYTSAIDAVDNENFNYQIKCIKIGSSIDLGDIFRNSKKSKDFYLVVGFWKTNKDNIVKVYRLYIDKDKWSKIFEFTYYAELKDWITNKVSNEYSYDKQWKSECSYFKNLWNAKLKRRIQLRFKRDHKKQRRIQCAINKTDFFEYFLKEFKNWEENIF